MKSTTTPASTTDELSAKAEERIIAMEDPGYEFPPAFRRRDAVGAAIVIVAMFAWLVVSFWL